MATLFTRDTRLPILLLFVFSLLIYSGILQNGWHLDDSGNILHNTPLHITDLRLSTLLKTFYAHPQSTGKLYRPISNFTFALNWFSGQNSPISYHLVDIAIHGFTAIVLYLTCLQLFKTPALTARDYSQTKQKNIALLTAALWLAAPIHTSAVTYIVQRMAQLAAFFSLAAVFFYLKARVSNKKLRQATFFIIFLCCIILALGSKENAILIFPSLGLVEGIFFLQFTRIQKFARQKKILFPLLFLLLTGVTLYLSWDFITAQANSYGHRNFTFQERLLTEPRILLFYLSQIFYPTASRLSIAHDITVSTSLFSPWQTLPAIASCIGLIFFGILQVNKKPLLSFALLYYFLNHLVESTIIPLELIFEHRNLLPSLFLFLPIAAFLVKKIHTKKWATILTGATCVLFLFQSGYATIERNKAWKNTGTLNEDALVKAPVSARVKLNLASWYAKQKNFEEALSLCEEAEQLEASGASRNRIIPIARMQQGSIFYELGQQEKAIKYFREAYTLRKDYTAAAEKLIAVLIERKYYNEAQQIITERYAQKKDPNLLLLQASVFLRQDNPTEALLVYHKSEQFYQNMPLIAAGKGKAFILTGNYDLAKQSLTKAVQQNDPIAKLLVLENNLLAGKEQLAATQLNQLVQNVPLINLLRDLNAAEKDPFQIPVNKPLLQKAILQAADNFFVSP